MVRIDKWLWAARFYKTRSLAKKHVEQGKVRINGQKCKPSRNVSVDDMLTIKKLDLIWDVKVLELAEKRVGAKIAVTLYQETEESIKAREAAVSISRMEYQSTPKPDSRPTKKQRRDIKNLKSRQ